MFVLKVVELLRGHSPALESHEDYEVETKQLTGYSSLMTFELKDAHFETVKAVVNKVKACYRLENVFLVLVQEI